MTAAALLREVVAALDEAGIPHMLVGSFASTAYSSPRSTQDIDIVIDPTPEALARFVGSFDSERVYVDGVAAQDALGARDQLNLIDVTTGWKVDLMILKDRSFDRSQFERRRPARTLEVDLSIATAEDTILAKLRWALLGGSDRQVADAAGVLAVQGDRLDHDYLDRWAAELGVTELLARARKG